VLQAEKNMMFFLLIFITIVAAFGITNTLITVTVQKTREIGVMKALGFQPWGVMGIFLWQGAVAGVIGTAAGIGTGLGALRYRNDLLRFLNERFGVELLPAEFYQLAQIPSLTTGRDLAMIAAVALTICLLAGAIPAWRAARLDPAQALRYE
jgi:lipoprotein-releasing system permease protein